MKVIPLFFTLIILTFISCKKKEIDPIVSECLPSSENTGNYFPLTVGSYWIYENIFIDSNGVVSITGINDTVQILGDTIYNGHQYSIFNGNPFFSQNGIFLFRDSAGIIINSNNNIIFDTREKSATTEIVTFVPEYQITSSTTQLKNAWISVPAGNFEKILDVQGIISRVDGNPINLCNDFTFKQYNYYSSGIGLLKLNWEYYNFLPLCQYHERRLVEYSIP